jgi:cytochrome b
MKILFWNLPVRVFHWMLAAAFTVAYLTGEGEHYRGIHVICGYLVACLIAYRLLWGVVGPRWSQFVRGVAAVYRQLAALPAASKRSAGPHQAFSFAVLVVRTLGVFALLVLFVAGLATPVSGWLSYNEIGGDALEEMHEVLSSLMLMAVGVHLASLALGSWLLRKNLARPMLFRGGQGGQERAPKSAAGRVRPVFAALLLVGLIAFAPWAIGELPAAQVQTGVSTHGHGHGHHERDDDD